MALRYLFTGVTSIHGWPLFKDFHDKFTNTEILGIRSPKMKIPAFSNVLSCCITDKDALFSIKKDFKPTHVIHCAGVCDLDVCEERPEWAYSMNTVGSRNIAEIFGDSARILYMSSDLVFSGNNTSTSGYSETDQPDPVSVAGKTIASAEKEIAMCTDYLIFRLGLPIGPSITGDKGAVDFIDYRLRRQLPLTLFYDEWRSCISCGDIISATVSLLESTANGIYHLGGPEKFSLYEIGKWVLQKNNYEEQLLRGIMRREEVNGPPRIGDVSLDSSKIQKLLNFNLGSPLRYD